MARLFDDGSLQWLNGTPPLADVPLTIAAWAKSDSASLAQNIISLGDTADGSGWVRLAFMGNVGGDPLRAHVASAASAVADSTAGYSVDTWHHCCGTFSAGLSANVYLDGGNNASAGWSSYSFGWNDISIGRLTMSSTLQYFSGSVAEVGIWSAVLDAGEIASLAKGCSPLLIRPSALVFYVPLVRDADQDIVGGLSLTANNAPTISAHPRVIYPSRPQTVVPSGAAPPGLSIPVAARHYATLRGE